MSGREQFMNREEGKNVLILSPLTGRAVPLEEVPDPVFSQKIIGDGMAGHSNRGEDRKPGRRTDRIRSRHSSRLWSENRRWYRTSDPCRS